MVFGFWAATALEHRMMRLTVLEHVSADLAWYHRNDGTEGDPRYPSRRRRLRGTTKAAAVMVSFMGHAETHTDRGARQEADR
ncbi:hypothetical protein OHA72_01460 [Dactylosporangium sp. NBC_01737]|uniref:hypothetical protein n=1 Tax=Dactylosporangium sp. NBC_01737 TaxID=2975959 RepID=UPI002E14EF8F|nr:hypothetical protein OHA72_01460 [Dactylosporangium sp. NBC_01737]